MKEFFFYFFILFVCLEGFAHVTHAMGLGLKVRSAP